MDNKDIAVQIKTILAENELAELKKSLDKRHCLNRWNIPVIYLFHLSHSAGILVTSIAASYNDKNLIWLGIGLNILSTVINVFEKTNRGISKKLLANIKAIKEGTFVDETDLSEVVEKSKIGEDKSSSVNNEKKEDSANH